jgi:hypothetical protein
MRDIGHILCTGAFIAVLFTVIKEIRKWVSGLRILQGNPNSASLKETEFVVGERGQRQIRRFMAKLSEL